MAIQNPNFFDDARDILTADIRSADPYRPRDIYRSGQHAFLETSRLPGNEKRLQKRRVMDFLDFLEVDSARGTQKLKIYAHQ